MKRKPAPRKKKSVPKKLRKLAPLDSRNWISESSRQSANARGDSSGSPLEITAAALPNGNVGIGYSASVSATGGMPPYYQWSATNLPPGLVISALSTISGLPTASGTYEVTVKLKDSASLPNEATKTFTIVIGNSLTITTTGLPNGSVGADYDTIVSAAGGMPPYYQWSASNLPPGLYISASSAIGGTPTAGGTYDVTVKVKDSASPPNEADKILTIVIEQLTITTTKLPDGTLNKPYPDPLGYPLHLAATGGTAPYQWLASGLPDGLSMSMDGIISGTPTMAGDYLVELLARDSNSQMRSGTKRFWFAVWADENALETKLEVVTGNPFNLASIAAGSGVWGQPANSAVGSIIKKPGGATTLVFVRSRNSPGGACNTVGDQREGAGTIKLFVRTKQPGDFFIRVYGSITIGATGPRGGATGKLEVGGNTVIPGFGTTAEPFSKSDTFETTTRVTEAWTIIAHFTPTIGLSEDFGVQSQAWVVGFVQFLSGTRQ